MVYVDLQMIRHIPTYAHLYVFMFMSSKELVPGLEVGIGSSRCKVPNFSEP